MSEANGNSVAAGPGPGPGARLQQAREKRGMTAVEAAERLHLDPSAIAAMEANRFRDLGPAVFAKGHLRQYAILLGLPTEEIQTAYESARQETIAIPLQAPPPPIETPKPPSKLFMPIAAALLAVTFVLGALIAWKPWRLVTAHDAAPVTLTNSGASGASLSAAAPTDAQMAPLPEGGIDSGGAAAPAGAPVTQAAAAAALPAGLQGVGRARLRMSFSADSWVEIRDAGGATLYRGKGPANSVKVVSGLAPLNVYLGYVSGVQLQVNNRAVAIGPQFVRGDVARFDAGADGVLRRSPRS